MTIANILIPYLVNSLCGAIILILLDIWLRRKEVKDPTLIWLYGSLISWAVAIGAELIEWKWMQIRFGIPSERFKYLFSIVSSILFVMAAFQLSRVRDAFGPKNYKHLRRAAIIIVTAISVIAWILQFSPKYATEAKFTDAFASSIAGFILGWGLSYSFRKYGNWLLVGLTVVTFSIFIWRQFDIAQNGTPTSGFRVPFFLWNSTLVIMLFIALAVAWALSDASRLRPVGGSSNVQVITMFFDLRGSTRWANDVVDRDFNYVRTFIDELREWAWNQVSTPPNGRPNLIKFLGDGFLFVWEIPDDSVTDNSNAVIELANNLRTNYQSWVNEEKFKNKFPWGVPIGIGLGVDVGPAIRLTFENGSDDYLGSPLNIAAKMQDLARPSGGGVIQAKVWKLLNESLRGKFPKEGMMKLGDRGIFIRMTEEVEF
jgi:class 3 adenylate cyclase